MALRNELVTVTLDKQTAREVAVALWSLSHLLDNIPPNDSSEELARLRMAAQLIASQACDLPTGYFRGVQR